MVWTPPPPVHPTGCNGQVCITVNDTKLLSDWIFSMVELGQSLAGCPLVEVVSK